MNGCCQNAALAFLPQTAASLGQTSPRISFTCCTHRTSYCCRIQDLRSISWSIDQLGITSADETPEHLQHVVYLRTRSLGISLTPAMMLTRAEQDKQCTELAPRSPSSTNSSSLSRTLHCNSLTFEFLVQLSMQGILHLLDLAPARLSTMQTMTCESLGGPERCLYFPGLPVAHHQRA